MKKYCMGFAMFPYVATFLFGVWNHFPVAEPVSWFLGFFISGIFLFLGHVVAFELSE